MMGNEATTIIRGLRSGWANANPTTDAKTIGVMETLDGLGYITTGFSFLLIGMVVFAHSWYVFLLSVGSTAIPAVLALVHDLLLVIILLELFRTIINFLKTKIITLEPFLYICVIASTRRILTTGAQIASMENWPIKCFTDICSISGRMCWWSWPWFSQCILCGGPFRRPLFKERAFGIRLEQTEV